MTREQMQRETPSLFLDALKGAVAGAVGTFVMEKFVTTPLYAAEGEATRKREEAAHPGGKSAPVAVATSAAKLLLGRELSPDAEAAVAKSSQVLMGAASGALYGIVRKRVRSASAARGLAFGATVYLVGDELLMPLLGFAAGPRRYPWQAHVRGLLGHLAFGAATDAALRVLPQGRTAPVPANLWDH